MVQIIVGSTNPAKVDAVRRWFPSAQGMTVDSGVAAQPLSDEETRIGALHRARECVANGASVGIGLEGGVTESEAGMLVINWGALTDGDGSEVIAGGARFPLPERLAEQVRRGKELGEVIDACTGRQALRKKEGAVGIFTNGLVTRDELYADIVRLLVGQYECAKRND